MSPRMDPEASESDTMRPMPTTEASIASQLTVHTRSPSTAQPSSAVSSGALLMMTRTSATDVSLNAITTAVEALA